MIVVFILLNVIILYVSTSLIFIGSDDVSLYFIFTCLYYVFCGYFTLEMVKPFNTVFYIEDKTI